jgi:hypothetical protein
VNPLVPRAIIAVVAVLLVAWFAVLARDQLIGTRALDRVEQNPAMSRADWERTVADLRRAELLNPGSEFRLARAAALILHDRPGAQRLVDSILRREPDNVEAWSILLAATRGRDEARFQEAVEQVRRLTGTRAGYD